MSTRVAWPALPALILLFVFFLFPVVRMLGFSLEGGTLEWYAKALGGGAVSAGDVEHLRDRPVGHAVLPAAGISAGLPDRHDDTGLGDAGLHLRAAAALDLGAGAHLRLERRRAH